MDGADPKSYRWLSVGALVALALAALIGAVAVRQAAKEHQDASDVKVRAERTMQRIEERLRALENESATE